MSNQIDFTELEAKTSRELVDVIKQDITAVNGTEKKVRVFKIEQLSWDTDFDVLMIYMIANEDCYLYSFFCKPKYFIRNHMDIYYMKKFMKMYQERMDEIGD